MSVLRFFCWFAVSNFSVTSLSYYFILLHCYILEACSYERQKGVDLHGGEVWRNWPCRGGRCHQDIIYKNLFPINGREEAEGRQRVSTRQGMSTHTALGSTKLGPTTVNFYWSRLVSVIHITYNLFNLQRVKEL